MKQSTFDLWLVSSIVCLFMALVIGVMNAMSVPCQYILLVACANVLAMCITGCIKQPYNPDNSDESNGRTKHS